MYNINLEDREFNYIIELIKKDLSKNIDVPTDTNGMSWGDLMEEEQNFIIGNKLLCLEKNKEWYKV